jgi:uncharacterized protein YbbC (DUF1343 family)
MVITGLEKIKKSFPKELTGKNVGVVCHAASIDSEYNHILSLFKSFPANLKAIFGPQHGLFGQTQDNMIEWDGDEKEEGSSEIPVYSLYGETRKPTTEMIDGLDALIIDLQDVGARPYTYIWTIKHALEAAIENDISIWVLDRPNPVGGLGVDGGVLKSDHFTFVGGANIPLCHGMTMGEMALFVQKQYFPEAKLNVVWMENYKSNSFFDETGLPWVLPSPNMPTLDTAIVYPGMVLFETINVSEGRGSVIPFELFGAPFINKQEFLAEMKKHNLEGFVLREHDFIPTFNKFSGENCAGFQIHITDRKKLKPVALATAIMKSINDSSTGFKFTDGPYEYEYDKLPIDIVSGDAQLRNWVESGGTVSELQEIWIKEQEQFFKEFLEVKHY